jgi:hypothetical protein
MKYGVPVEGIVAVLVHGESSVPLGREELLVASYPALKWPVYYQYSLRETEQERTELTTRSFKIFPSLKIEAEPPLAIHSGDCGASTHF